MRRTLLITIDFPPKRGGIANYWANLNKFFPKDDFLVLAPETEGSRDYDTKQNYLIYRKNLISQKKWAWPKWLPLFFSSWSVIRQERIEKIIVTHILPVGTMAYLIKNFLRIPYVVSVHGLDLALTFNHKRKAWLAKKILSQADNIIVNSSYTKNLVLKYEPNWDKKIVIVYPCPNIRFEQISPVRKNNFLRKFNLSDKKIILTVARVVERKGQDQVVRALPKVLQEVPQAVYLIVGSGSYFQELRKLVAVLNLENQIYFFPDILDHELPVFYTIADVFIMPSRQLADGDVEGFGTVYLEANNYGLPAIAGNVGGAKEAVEHNVNGLLVDPHEVAEISQALIKLLGDRETAQKLGLQGKKRVEEQFSWYKQAQKVTSILS